MSIPTLRAVGRLSLASVCIALLYIALDVAVMGLGTRGLAAFWSWQERSGSLDAQARVIAAQAAAHPSAARPALRLAAWRLGHAFGVASQAAHNAAIGGNARLAELADGVARDADADARALGLAPITPLAGRSFAEAAALPQRIEDDESGLAARIESATTALHRHLFLAGAHTGLEWVARSTPGAPENPLRGRFIAAHARLGGLDPSLWQPLTDPPGADAAQRRQAFFGAMAAVQERLSAAPPR